MATIRLPSTTNFQKITQPFRARKIKLVEFVSVARVRPRTSKGITDLLLPQASIRTKIPRLTQSRSALLWKPWIFSLEDSHFYLATHSGILTCIISTAPYGTASAIMQRSPTNPHIHVYSIASVVCFSPGHFRRKISRLVSYYALFECVAASEPTS